MNQQNILQSMIFAT